MRKCEVKKLDNNTFNTGAEGKEYLRPVRAKLESVLAIIKRLDKEETIKLSVEQKNLIKSFQAIKPDELSVGTLRRLNDVCKVLNSLYEALKIAIPTVSPFVEEGTHTPITMSSDIYISICELLDRPYPASLETYKDQITQLRYIQHPYVINPISLREDLHSLLKLFEGLTLIIVDERKGYMVLDSVNRISFERITRGNPRFRVDMPK